MVAELFAEDGALAREGADPSRRADFRVPPWPGARAPSGPTSPATRSGCSRAGRRRAVADELDAWAELAVEGWFEGERPWLTASDELRPAIARLVGRGASRRWSP